MHSVFLSYSFRDEGTDLHKSVRTIIEAVVGIPPIDGKVLQGASVTPSVRDRLAGADVAVCLLTTSAHDTGWVDAEFWMAFGAGKKAFLIAEDGVDGSMANPYRGLQYIIYEPSNPLDSIAQLAAHLGVWKQGQGRRVRAVLLPEQVNQLATSPGATCEYRCEDPYATTEETWRPARIRRSPGGALAILGAVAEEQLVQVRLMVNGSVYESDYLPQDLTITLKTPAGTGIT